VADRADVVPANMVDRPCQLADRADRADVVVTHARPILLVILFLIIACRVFRLVKLLRER